MIAASFTKLFASITDSSIWSEDSDTKVVWVTMLAMSDQFGRVCAAIPGLAKRAGVTVESTEKALLKFLSPDKFSRTKDHEGKRIEEIEGGWRLLNHELYRDMRSEEDRKEQNRLAQQRRRDKARNQEVSKTSAIIMTNQKESSNSQQNVSNSQQNQPRSAHTDTDTDTKKEESPSSPVIPDLSVKKTFKAPNQLVREWSKAYMGVLGKAYLESEKDTAAANRLMGLPGTSIGELMEIAKKAWTLDDKNSFERGHSMQLSSFASQFNKIRHAVGDLKVKPKITAEGYEISTKSSWGTSK